MIRPDAHIGLLARARAALEMPAGPDPAPRMALIADIAEAEKLFVARQSPGPSDNHSLLETGRYCVLGTAHLSVATADMLDHWSSERAQDRLLNIASCIYGWFIPTREIDAATRRQLPADLLAAMQFGRDRGFDHILFDCDAATVDGLAVHNW